jgi:rubrerythrin
MSIPPTPSKKIHYSNLMMSIDEILFDQDLPCSIPTSIKLRNTIVNKFGNIKCFKFQQKYQRSSPLREIIFTKYGVGSAYTGNFHEIRFSNSFLFGIKCITNNQFNYEFYDKYKNMVISADNTSSIDEKNALLLKQVYLQKKYQELERKFKHEQQKNEVLVDLYKSQIISNIEISSDSKYDELLKLYNEQSKQIAFLRNENDQLKHSTNSCLICYEKTETHYICNPCNHVLNIHDKCLIRATRCPICNQITTTREQVFLS